MEVFGELARKVNLPVSQSRTQWAERHAEELLSVPFIAEFVFRSLQTVDVTQKGSRRLPRAL